MLETKLRTKKA